MELKNCFIQALGMLHFQGFGVYGFMRNAPESISFASLDRTGLTKNFRLSRGEHLYTLRALSRAAVSGVVCTRGPLEDFNHEIRSVYGALLNEHALSPDRVLIRRFMAYRYSLDFELCSVGNSVAILSTEILNPAMSSVFNMRRVDKIFARLREGLAAHGYPLTVEALAQVPSAAARVFNNLSGLPEAALQGVDPVLLSYISDGTRVEVQMRGLYIPYFTVVIGDEKAGQLGVGMSQLARLYFEPL